MSINEILFQQYKMMDKDAGKLKYILKVFPFGKLPFIILLIIY